MSNGSLYKRAVKTMVEYLTSESFKAALAHPDFSDAFEYAVDYDIDSPSTAMVNADLMLVLNELGRFAVENGHVCIKSDDCVRVWNKEAGKFDITWYDD